MRGAGGAVRPREQRAGIIPACAGSSCGRSPPSARRGNHPRVCGEQSNNPISRKSQTGSSPRVRGAAVALGVPAHGLGIIPACAGSSVRRVRPPKKHRDHPRVCGEQLLACSMLIVVSGSSPRVRGAGGSCSGSGRHNGIIPACAGSRDSFALRHSSFGIIPACAGSRSGRPSPWSSSRDHPRVCGEQPFPCPFSVVSPGSSPRVRGAGPLQRAGIPPAGIIPACAGSSQPHCQLRYGLWDHPRVCGEQHPFGFLLQHKQGSSPRVRGAASTS